MNTLAETLIQQGLEKGVEQELERGRKRMLRLLELKFGPVDASIRQRAAEADGDTLDRWCERSALTL